MRSLAYRRFIKLYFTSVAEVAPKRSVVPKQSVTEDLVSLTNSTDAEVDGGGGNGSILKVSLCQYLLFSQFGYSQQSVGDFEKLFLLS